MVIVGSLLEGRETGPRSNFELTGSNHLTPLPRASHTLTTTTTPARHPTPFPFSLAMFKKRTRPANVRAKEDAGSVAGPSSTNAEASTSTAADELTPTADDDDLGPSVG